MLDALDATNVDALGLPLTVRSVFIIDPKKVIRLILSYPASTGRNVDELLRVIDSLQVSTKYKVATPVDWTPGKDVIVANSVKKEEADQLFPGYRSVKVSFWAGRAGRGRYCERDGDGRADFVRRFFSF